MAYPVLRDNDAQLLDVITAKDDDVDRLYDAIKIYLARVMQRELSEEESGRAQEILSFTSNMEHIGDIVEGGLMELATKKIKLRAHFSESGLSEIETMHEMVAASFDLAINTFVSGDVELARQLYDAKIEIRDLERKTLAAHFERLGKGMTESIATSSLHLDLVRDLKRINSHLTAIAYPVLKASGEVPRTKWKRRNSP
jgi:phosphate:Na+ symporter